MSKVRTAIAVFVVVVSAAAAAPRTAAADSPPNILFILTDDQRWDAMGCYGNPVLRTPAFNRIASEGARLDAFYVASPLCCPSRAALLSGLYPHQRGNGVLDNRRGTDLPAGSPTVATRLKQFGYVTGFVGKAHLGGDPRQWGFEDCPVWLPGGSSGHENPHLMFNGRPRTAGGKTITATFAGEGIRFIERHKDERWFLWFATSAPHTPYYHDPHHPYTRWQVHRAPPPPGWPPNDPLSGYDWAAYYSTTALLDDQVGRLVHKLDQLGIAQNTLVVVLSDNGMMHGSHGLVGKGVWYEESVRVPALVRWPGHVPARTRVSAPAAGIDLLPTLLEAAGGSKSDDLPGKSLLPALTSGTPSESEVFCEARKTRSPLPGEDWQLARHGRWKYIRLRDGSEKLYDLEKDPGEKLDLAASDGDAAAALADMRQRLDRWLAATP